MFKYICWLEKHLWRSQFLSNLQDYNHSVLKVKSIIDGYLFTKKLQIVCWMIRSFLKLSRGNICKIFCFVSLKGETVGRLQRWSIIIVAINMFGYNFEIGAEETKDLLKYYLYSSWIILLFVKFSTSLEIFNSATDKLNLIAKGLCKTVQNKIALHQKHSLNTCTPNIFGCRIRAESSSFLYFMLLQDFWRFF